MKYKVNNTIKFKEDGLSYTIQAVSERYLICTRPFDKKEDSDIIEKDLEIGAYGTEEEALEDLENLSIYTIVDLEESIRGGDNYNSFSDYSTQKECEEVLRALYTKEVEISRRNRTTLNII